MLIIGHPWVESPKFHKVFSLEDIARSQANEVLLLEALKDSHTLARYCQDNGVAYAVEVSTVKEAVFANALGAKYMLCKEKDALNIQSIAQEYLFDTRILAVIDNEKEITNIAKNGIDGVIFTEAIYT